METVKYYLGLYGEKIGWAIIILVTLWDFFFTGARNLLHYSICWKGLIALWVGILLIKFSKYIEKNY
jgi:hypothetical protein